MTPNSAGEVYSSYGMTKVAGLLRIPQFSSLVSLAILGGRILFAGYSVAIEQAELR
jgi:hypothetical protein